MSGTLLDQAQRQRWERDGFLVLEDFISTDRCDQLMEHAAALADAHRSEQATVFTTNEQERHADEVFLGSASEMVFFWESEAVGDDGQPLDATSAAFNKMGHAAHDLDPVFDSFSRQDPLGQLVDELGVADPRLLQSMLIFKHAGIGGEVVSHQDATFLYTEPGPDDTELLPVIGLWFALEDATVENGCLFAQPGGHRSPLRRRFRRIVDGDTIGTEFIELDDTPLPQLGDPELVALEVPKGTCVVLHGLLPHGSHTNRSARSRQAYTLHLIDGRANYPEDNWLQRPDLPFRGFE